MLRVWTSGRAAKDCKFNQAKGKVQGKGKAKNTPPDKNTPAKFEGESPLWQERHKWTDCRKRLAEAKDKKVHAVGAAPSTATVAAVEDTEVTDEAGISGNCSDDENNGDDGNEAWVLSVEGNDTPADAEFFPLDSACEEHTCPWNFAEGGRDLGPNGLSIPSGRKVMVSYDVLGPGGRVILHAQTPFVQSDVKRPLLSVGRLTQSGAEDKFGDKNSWIDLQTDAEVQRVPGASEREDVWPLDPED